MIHYCHLSRFFWLRRYYWQYISTINLSYPGIKEFHDHCSCPYPGTAGQENVLKSVNLKYNTLVCWDVRTKDSQTKHLMFPALFFPRFLSKSFSKIFLIYSLFFLIKIRSFECPKSIKNYEKTNAWIIRRLDNESFVSASQQTSILYCSLTDFLSWDKITRKIFLCQYKATR